MIVEIFGKPSGMPLEINDCLLIISDKKIIPIEKVFLFTKSRMFPVRAFGDLWMANLITDIKKFDGYFNCKFDFEFFSDQTELYTIQSNPVAKKPIYVLNGVSFNRINNIELSESFIKFSCINYEIIMDS